MSPAVTRATSRHVSVKGNAAVPYFLRSRVPLGNASNVIGVHRGADVPKRQKAVRVKKENRRAARAPSDETHDHTSVCDPVKVSTASVSDPVKVSTASVSDPVKVSTASVSDPVKVSTASVSDPVKVSTASVSDPVKVSTASVCDPVKVSTASVSDPVKQPVTHTHTDLQEPAAAPQAFSCLLLNIIPDVDSADALDAQMCSEYVRDINAYLRQLEVTMAIRPHYLEGQEVSGSMRAVAIDWLMQVQREFKLRQETFFMSVGIIDRFLQNNPVPKKCFQLVCVTAMLLASKYEEIYPPTVGDFAFVTDGTYTCGDVRRMERIVLKRLNYSLGRPGPVHFLQRACKVGQASTRAGELAMFLLELAVLDYELIHVPPSLMAAAAFAASLRILGSGDWSPSLQHYTGYDQGALSPVVRAVAHTLKTLPGEGKLHEMNRKYVKMSSGVCESDGFFSERVQKLLC